MEIGDLAPRPPGNAVEGFGSGGPDRNLSGPHFGPSSADALCRKRFASRGMDVQGSICERLPTMKTRNLRLKR
jgi:hypothetical protein